MCVCVYVCVCVCVITYLALLHRWVPEVEAWGSDSKQSACNAEDLGLIPGLGRCPGEGNGYPPQYSCLENPHGQRCLAGYSPWGHKESDMTEQLSIHSTAQKGKREKGPKKTFEWIIAENFLHMEKEIVKQV